MIRPPVDVPGDCPPVNSLASGWLSTCIVEVNRPPVHAPVTAPRSTALPVDHRRLVLWTDTGSR